MFLVSEILYLLIISNQLAFVTLNVYINGLTFQHIHNFILRLPVAVAATNYRMVRMTHSSLSKALCTECVALRVSY